MTVLKFCIDWLSLTSKRNSGPETRFSDYLSPYMDSEVIMRRPMSGYTNAMENRAGAIVLWSMKRADMGIHVEYSGSTLNAYRAIGKPAEEIVTEYVFLGDTITRIDLAIDVLDSGMDVKQLNSQLNSGKAQAHGGRKWNLRADSDGGATLYIGAWSSTILLRIYDKGKEMKTDDDWVRIELRILAPKANPVARRIAVETTENAVSSMRGMLNAIVHFPGKLWREIATDGVIKITVSDNKESDTRAWLLDLVAPAFGKYLARTGDPLLTAQFLEIVEEYRRVSDEWKKEETKVSVLEAISE